MASWQTVLTSASDNSSRGEALHVVCQNTSSPHPCHTHGTWHTKQPTKDGEFQIILSNTNRSVFPFVSVPQAHRNKVMVALEDDQTP